MSKTSAIDLVMERVNKFVTCGCCDDDWPPLRRDIADTITRLQAALEEIAEGVACDRDHWSAAVAREALRSSVGGE
jgi:hypothetical protein